mgnify:CR=1 FL=1
MSKCPYHPTVPKRDPVLIQIAFAATVPDVAAPAVPPVPTEYEYEEDGDEIIFSDNAALNPGNRIKLKKTYKRPN